MWWWGSRLGFGCLVLVRGLAVAGLVLSVAGGASASSWRWVLTEAESGNPVADFSATLDRDAFEHAGLVDLYRFLRWEADPGRRTASEVELVDRVGAWIGATILGGQVAAAMVDYAPVTVRVELPAVLEFLLYRPLELAHVGGVPLAAHEVSLLFQLPDAPAGPAGGAAGAAAGRVPLQRKRPVGASLRVLGVFSLPTGASVLGLRRERYELSRLARELGGRAGRAVEVEVLQYGVTRERLQERARDGEGWDVLHLSGHGAAGTFLLEHPDGSLDPVGSHELVQLLRPARARVKLAVVAACESGAASAAETLHLLSLDRQAESWQEIADTEVAVGPEPGVDLGGSPQTGAAANPDPVASVVGGMARELGRELQCPVLAMRYPVIDDFAIALTGGFYRLLWESGQPVDAALRLALADLTAAGPSAAVPPISLAVPTLFGTGADLVLRPPTGRRPDLSAARMAGFPQEPQRFVGRTQVLAAASAALAPDSGRAGVLVHGMAGAGKTACALELAYRHQDTFAALAFWKGPEHDEGVFGAIEDLAQRLESQLGEYGFTMADKVATLAELETFLPRLTQILEDNGLLLVLDNLEHLLDNHGRWRDDRWAALVGALTGHRGLSRVILTSRTRPTGLDEDATLVSPIHALSLAESVLLARELPHLRDLLGVDDTDATVRGTDLVEGRRDLLRRTLAVVQGHPKLLELADAAAADPDRLASHLDQAELAAPDGGAVLAAFTTTGTSSLDPDAFLTQLTGWTTTTTSSLPEASRLLLQVLCCLEDPDRTSDILSANWADIWARLERPSDPPKLDQTLDPLVSAALVHPETLGGGDWDGDGTEHPALVGYRIHPGVADAIRADAGRGVQAAVDTELAGAWHLVFQSARERPGGEATGVVVRAGLAAAPYLMRLNAWNHAGALLEGVTIRDQSPATIRAVIPHLRRIAETTDQPGHAGILGAALASVDSIEAETWLRRGYDGAVASDDHRVASGAASDLVNFLQTQGRLREALAMVEQKAQHTKDAGLGPANQIADQGQRLQILNELGEHQRVLDEIEALRPQLDQFPDHLRDDESVEPFIVKEFTLDVGRSAALALKEWETVLELNHDIITSRQRRGAGRHEIARVRYNDCVPLIRLGRLEEADQILQGCQQDFEDAADTNMLGKVLSTRADLEEERGRSDQAVRFSRTALRYAYTTGDWNGAAVDHYNHAAYLLSDGEPAQSWLPHRLAATMIDYAIRGASSTRVQVLGVELHRFGDAAAAATPANVAELTQRVEIVEGVRFAQLVARLTGKPDGGDTLMTNTLNAAREHIAQAAADDEALVASWEPRIAAVVATATIGDTDTGHRLDAILTDLEANRDWAALVGVLRRIIAGERDPHQLLAGLDSVDTAIAARTLDALAGRVELAATPDDLQPEAAVPDSREPVIAAVVATANGTLDADAHTELDSFLTDTEADPDWAALVGVLRRIIAGDRDTDQLLAGLDPVDTAITTRILDALTGRTESNPPEPNPEREMSDPVESPPNATQTVIAALTDTQAIQALALVVTRGKPPAPSDPELESHLREAATNTTRANETTASDVSILPPTTDADLARLALNYLATTAEYAADVDRAIAITRDQPTERFEPTTMVIGGLILLALQTEVSLDRDQHGRWKFRFHKHHMRDTTLGTLLGKLIGTYATPPTDPTA